MKRVKKNFSLEYAFSTTAPFHFQTVGAPLEKFGYEAYFL